LVIYINNKIACESKAVYGKKGDAVRSHERIHHIMLIFVIGH
jgi:hypothetical protein